MIGAKKILKKREIKNLLPFLMDLLEIILRSTGCEEYHDLLKNNGVDSFSLKILNEQDLIILGVHDEEKRKHFLKVADNLQIPSEKKISLIIDNCYTLLLLNQMSFHFQKQLANLTYILRREDVDICDINLTPAVSYLQIVLSSFQEKLNIFEDKVLKVKKIERRKKYIIIPSIIVAAAALTTLSKIVLKY